MTTLIAAHDSANAEQGERCLKNCKLNSKYYYTDNVLYIRGFKDSGLSSWARIESGSKIK